MKLTRTRFWMVAALLLSSAGCAHSPPTPAPWVPGTYQYRSTLPNQGIVTGTIEVAAEGPVSVTSNVGGCLDTAPHNYRPWFRERTFSCAGRHTVRVELGHAGQPPIGGTVSNERTTTTTRVERSCREFRTEPTGEEVCIAWNDTTVTDRTTTGGTARFWLVSDSLAPRP